jgi:hypothetical protein
MRTRCFLLLLFFNVLPAWSETMLLSRGSVWRYHPFEAPANWTQAAFDDSGWPSGPAQLGYGEGDEQTIVYDDLPAFDPTTVYFRRAFSVTNYSEFRALTARLIADDGVILYLNGHEAVRRNMPAGPVNASTEAVSDVDINENAFESLAFGYGNLLEGTNWVCAEVHQYGPGRADCSFDFELVANLPIDSPQVSIISPGERSVLPREDFLIQTEVSDLSSRILSVYFYTNQVFLGAVMEAPFNLIWTDPPTGGYSVTARAFNEFGYSHETQPLHVYIGSPVVPQLIRGPYLQSGSATGMVLRWRTDWYSDALVRFGTNPAVLNQSSAGPDSMLDHEVQLSGLQPDTFYYYSIGSGSQTLATGDSFYFRTAPTNARPVRLWVVGDSGTGNEAAASVREAYYGYNGSTAADVFMMLGDNAYGNGLDSEYQRAVFEVYPDLLRHTVVWPTLGNHDAAENSEDFEHNGEPYLNIFTLPKTGQCGGVPSGSELYYSFDYANIHIVCLDSFLSSRATNGPMLSWLASDLAATEKDWIIAFWHHPPYTWGTHNSDSTEFSLSEMRQRALPLLESYGVDLVLCGHSHVYERSFLLNGHYGYSPSLNPSMILDSRLGRAMIDGPYRKPSGGLGANRGTVYVVCGCSGEGGVNEDFPLHPAMGLNHGGYGSLVIDVNGLRLTTRFLRPNKTIDDVFTIDKSLPATIRPRVGISSGVNGPVITWPTSNPFYSLVSSDVPTGHLWQPVGLLPETVGRLKRTTVPPEEASRFFRLRAGP